MRFWSTYITFTVSPTVKVPRSGVSRPAISLKRVLVVGRRRGRKEERRREEGGVV